MPRSADSVIKRPLTPSNAKSPIFISYGLQNGMNYPAASSGVSTQNSIRNAASGGEFNPKGLNTTSGYQDIKIFLLVTISGPRFSTGERRRFGVETMRYGW